MNTIRATRIVLRLGVMLLVLCAVVLYWNFGLLRVPAGMDTMTDTHPPGTLCVIEKAPSSLEEGAVVFIDLPDGSTVLTRVVTVHGDGSIAVRHDNRGSVFTYLEAHGPYRGAAVRGLVLTMFVTEAQGVPRDGG